ncbi:MAG: TonB-dependent receptor [Acidobacteria bacterium]|nr:TonB-dependent receptor [Acidobacteriota bacterium]
MYNKLLRKTLGAAFLSLFLAATNYAQHTSGKADLVGTIRDSEGAILSGATITLINPSTGIKKEMASDDKGNYSFSTIEPGSYNIQIENQGFATATYKDIRVPVGQSVVVNVELKVGGLQEMVTVEAKPPLIDLRQSQVAYYVDQIQIEELPVPFGGFIDFAALVPGITPSFSRAGGSFSIGAISANGIDNRFTNFTVDGAPNNDIFVGQFASAQCNIPTESIREFQVIPNLASAEYGRNASAVFNAVTKSGTNDFHFAAYGFLRNQRLQTKNEFTKRAKLPKPLFNQTQVGLSTSGPIKKDRTFFFGNFEYVVLKLGQSVLVPGRPDLTVSGTNIFRVEDYFVRVDHKINENNSLKARYATELSPGFFQGLSATVLPENTTTENDRDQQIVVALTSTLGTNKVNELRFSLTREDIGFKPQIASPLKPEELRPNFRAGSPNFIAGTNFEIPVNWNTQDLQFEDNFQYSFGQHDTKFGVSYFRSRLDRRFQDRLGQFLFNTNAAFDPRNASTYPVEYRARVGPIRYLEHNDYFSVFIADKWQPKENLTLNLGIRYERESLTPDPYNFAPRIGIVYSPGKENKTVIRAAGGLYYSQALFQFIERTTLFSPIGAVNFVARDNGPLVGQLPVNPILRNFPNVPKLDRASFPFNPNPELAQPNRRLPYVATASFGIQHQLTNDLGIKIDYVFSRGISLFRSRDLNAFNLKTQTRPDPRFGRILQYESTANSYYNAMLVSVEKRYAKNFYIQGAYTLSKTINEADTPFQLPNNEFNLRDDRGLASFDATHILAVQGLYNFNLSPIWNFTISGIGRAISGQPFSPITNRDDNRNFVTDRLAGFSRNTFRGPGFGTLDLRFTHEPKLSERFKFKFTLDVINLTNRVNFININNNVTGTTLPATFGVPRASLDGRVFQFGVRIER